ncbi:ATP-binding protein [Niallia nealsonii]|nr:ATP-binding protein [Niallia nealsonii]
MKKLLAFVLTIILFAIVGSIALHDFEKETAYLTKAVNGRIVVNDFDLQDNNVIELKGGWEFFRDKLLSSKDIAEIDNIKSEYVPVSQNWKDISGTNTGYGIGTYRLIIHVENPSGIYGLKINSIQMAHKMYLNGQLIAQLGNPGEKKDFISKNISYVHYLQLKKGDNELIIQVANFIHLPTGGINKPIFLGKQGAISDLRDRDLIIDCMTITSFFIMGFFFGGLFFQRRKEFYLVHFAFVCLFIGLYQFVHGEKVIYFLFPTISYPSVLRLQYLSLCGITITVYSYLLTAHKQYASKKWVYLFIGLSGYMLLYDLLFVEKVSGVFVFMHTVLGAISLFYACYIFIQSTLSKETEGYYLLFAAISIAAYTMLENINAYTNTYIANWVNLLPLVALMMFSLLLSLRFMLAFRKIEHLSTELIKTDQVKNEFLERTTHEFLTPLTGIRQITESMLKSKELLEENNLQKMELIRSLSFRLTMLVHEISDFVNLKQGLLKMEKVIVDVHATITIEISIFQIIAQQKKVKIVNQVPANTPFIIADENRFRQIVGNLLDNAVKNTHAGEIIVSAVQKGNYVNIIVKDNGGGMGQKKLEQVMNLLHHNMESDHLHGLGLKIVKQLLNLQDGKITVVSKEGEGTVVTFSLPMSMQSKIPSYKARKNTENDRNFFQMATPYFSKVKAPYTVLLVDDSDAFLKIMADIIESIPANVIAVKDGCEALSIMNRNAQIDLVVVDLVMPKISGYELSKKIRENYSLVDLPILMMLESSYHTDKINILQMGANDVINKPFDYAEFEARVKNLLMMKEAVNQSIAMEVAFLQSQIKPHFLFNVLNTINALSYTDIEQSREVTENFAEYLRNSFDFHNTNTLIPFEKEMQLITSYVEIEKMRFRDRIHIQYDIKVKDFMVPPLIVQPVIENAIRHGISKKAAGGFLFFSVEQKKKQIMITIEDTGVGMSPETLASIFSSAAREGHVGLKNINKRLKYYYGTELQITSEENSGTKVVLEITDLK